MLQRSRAGRALEIPAGGPQAVAHQLVAGRERPVVAGQDRDRHLDPGLERPGDDAAELLPGQEAVDDGDAEPVAHIGQGRDR